MHQVSRRFVALVVVLAVALGIQSVVLASDASPEATSAAPAVVRTVIDEGDPAAAPGQVLQLVRYDIPPNIALPVHIHPGMQVALVESGTLHYTVVEGEMHYVRANGESGVLKAGEETDFLPGDSLVEAQGMVHFGENRTDETIVLLVASLFEADVPPSSLVESTPVP